MDKAQSSNWTFQMVKINQDVIITWETKMLNLKYSPVQYMINFVTHLPYQLNFDFADWEQNKSMTWCFCSIINNLGVFSRNVFNFQLGFIFDHI